MDTPDVPAPPDPAATAAAQASQNKATAITQAGLNMTNQVTPQGTLNYSQIGQWEDGTPRFQAETKLSPGQQGLYDLGLKTQTNLGQIGVDQSDKIRTLLNTPVNLNNDEVESRLMELGQKRLNPQLEARRKSTEQDLFNRGVRPGTEAYTTAMKAVTEGENDAVNQLLLTGRSQSLNEILTQRNQPLNEISALLSGSQVSQPNFVSTPNTGVAPTDVIGPTYASYNANVANANRAAGQNNAMLGGLFGLGGTLAGSALGGPLGGWAGGLTGRSGGGIA